jgi:hypothetical protein
LVGVAEYALDVEPGGGLRERILSHCQEAKKEGLGKCKSVSLKKIIKK